MRVKRERDAQDAGVDVEGAVKRLALGSAGELLPFALAVADASPGDEEERSLGSVGEVLADDLINLFNSIHYQLELTFAQLF